MNHTRRRRFESISVIENSPTIRVLDWDLYSHVGFLAITDEPSHRLRAQRAMTFRLVPLRDHRVDPGTLQAVDAPPAIGA
jgi:hypothetical protein